MKNTIKLFGMLILAASLMMAGNVSAQSSKAEKKENKELKKDQKELHNAVYKKEQFIFWIVYKNLISDVWMETNQ